MRCWSVMYVPSPILWETTSADRSVQAPFWADNRSDMYQRILLGDLQLPQGHSMDQDTKSLIRGASILCWLALRPHR